jgi:S-adenosylmethionine decarboxylase
MTTSTRTDTTVPVELEDCCNSSNEGGNSNEGCDADVPACIVDTSSTSPGSHENCENSNLHFLSDDECSGNLMERDYTGMFEGPEKTLEVVFRRLHGKHVELNMGEISPTDQQQLVDNGGDNDPRVGLRRLTREDLDLICARARCTILSCISNRYLDAYVLSESSLFIYPYMLVLKTCGTTTLLRCIATLIDMGRKLGLEIDWVGYSRKNFNFPGDQAFPHQSFHQELDYLYGHRSLCERLDGNGYTLGPVTGDHWFVFVADHTIRSKALEIDTDRVLNIMMFDIDETVAQVFTYDHYEQQKDGETKQEETERIGAEQTIKSGINALCPGAIIDPRAFEPCGYSMNAILFRSYSTIHITPESGSSYASFETNQKVNSYKALISNVIRTFRPRRFVMTLMADEGGLRQVKENPLVDSGAAAKIVVPYVKPEATVSSCSSGSPTSSPIAVAKSHQKRLSLPTTPLGAMAVMTAGNKEALVYKRSSTASIKVEDDCCCMMGNWVLEKPRDSPSLQRPVVNVRAGKERGMSMS